MYNFLAKIFKQLSKNTQWYLVWLFHPKFNIGLSIIIPNISGKLLLAKHVFYGNDPWRLIGGYINKDENIYTAAKREAKEELGLDIEIERVLRIRSGFTHRIEITLVAKPLDNPIFIIDKKEIQEVGWYEQQNEPEGTLESHKYLLKLYKEKSYDYFEVENL